MEIYSRHEPNLMIENHNQDHEDQIIHIRVELIKYKMELKMSLRPILKLTYRLKFYHLYHCIPCYQII